MAAQHIDHGQAKRTAVTLHLKCLLSLAERDAQGRARAELPLVRFFLGDPPIRLRNLLLELGDHRRRSAIARDELRRQ
jgi:hypothetical protein